MARRKSRLFLGNLPQHSSENDVRQRLQKYGTVNSVEIKHKKDFNSETITATFAYVNLETEDSTLQQCLRELRSKDWDGSSIKAELAKESFLDRLQREREEALKSSSAEDIKQLHDSTKNSNICTPSLSVKEEAFYRKRKSSFGDSSEECCEEENLVSKFESFSDLWKDDPPARFSRTPKKERTAKNSDSFRGHPDKYNFSKEGHTKSKSSNFVTDFADSSSRNSDSITAKSQIDDNSKSKFPDSGKDIAAKAGELKRIKALEEKSKVVKEQKDAIKHALSSVDQARPSNKIIFNDDGDPVSSPQAQPKVGLNKHSQKNDTYKLSDFSKEKEKSTSAVNGQLQLFGGDDDNDDWQGDFSRKKQFEGKKGKQLLEMQARFKDDERFVIDERFYESDDEKEADDKPPSVVATEEEKELQEEKAKEMEILASVLGEPVQPLVSKKNAFNPMVRFDPLKPSHAKFELPKPNDPKLKSVDIDQKKKFGKETEGQRVEDEPLPVDEKQFYRVATNLKDLFKKEEKIVQSTETGTFSLRQIFSSNEDEESKEMVEDTISKPVEITHNQSKPRPASRAVLRGFQNSKPLAMFTKKLLRPELNGISNTFCKDVDVEAIKEKFSEKRRVLGRMLHKKKVTLERQQHFKRKIGAASLTHSSVDGQSAIRRRSSTKPWEKKRARR